MTTYQTPDVAPGEPAYEVHADSPGYPHPCLTCALIGVLGEERRDLALDIAGALIEGTTLDEQGEKMGRGSKFLARYAEWEAAMAAPVDERAYDLPELDADARQMLAEAVARLYPTYHAAPEGDPEPELPSA